MAAPYYMMRDPTQHLPVLTTQRPVPQPVVARSVAAPVPQGSMAYRVGTTVPDAVRYATQQALPLANMTSTLVGAAAPIAGDFWRGATGSPPVDAAPVAVKRAAPAKAPAKTAAKAVAPTPEAQRLFGDQGINFRMFERLMAAAPAPTKGNWKDPLGALELQDQLGQYDAAMATQDAATRAAILEGARRRRAQLLGGGTALDLPAFQPTEG